MKKGLLTKASIGSFGLMSMASLANAAVTVDSSTGAAVPFLLAFVLIANKSLR